MFVNPFLLGVLATVFAELLLCFVIAMFWKEDKKEDGED